jgi:hypothetical protein
VIHASLLLIFLGGIIDGVSEQRLHDVAERSDQQRH